MEPAVIRPLREGFKYVGRCNTAGHDALNPKSPRFDPTFPRPISCGARAKGFLRAELDAWLAAQARKRDAALQRTAA